MPTKANIPMVVLLIPISANQVPKVADVNKSGNPEKNPTGKNINKFFSKHFLKSCNKVLIF